MIINLASLPGDWKDIPASSTKDFGTHLLKTAKKAVFKIPSCVIG
ncbi:MAG TPA: hypothetical protein VN722_03805 [Hanamia sp.]|nr:hypothetical protein [Hanamia sp.]